MSTHIRFNDDDDADEYQPTDSEDELQENERELLKKARSKGAEYSDSEDEVFGVYEESEASDDKSDLALSDVEGQGEDDDDDMPNAKAWGKNKKQYYSTDYVDQDYGGFQGTDAMMAEFEEQEAKNLQNELAKNLDDDDFALDFAPKELEVEESKEKSNVIKTDISQLSKRQKLQLLMKESPELFGLIEDYQKRMTVVNNELQPVIKFYKEGKIKKSDAMDFVNSYCQLILNYTVNISIYLFLKSQKIAVKNHPIIKRLYQYRQLLAQMDPVYEEQINPQFEVLLEKAENESATVSSTKNKKKLLNILKTAENAEPSTSNKRKRGEKEPKSILKRAQDETGQHSDKHITFASKDSILKSDSDDSDDENLPTDMKNLEMDDNIDEDNENNEEKDENVEKEADEIAKRGITYQIAKNKGLMPTRKKEQRNPRVKHRNKFRKAKIRRKGAVREVRHEIARYGGEISGIKASVSKSIKLKS